MKTQNLLLFFLIFALFIVPVFAENSSGTATIEDGTELPPPSPPGITDPIVFDLLVNTPDYIILGLSSKITTSIDVYNRVGRDAEVMFVWTIIDSNDIQVKNGSFLHLILGYQQTTLDVDVPAPKEEGDYTLQIDVPAIEVTGASTHPFHVYGILSFLLGPGWWILAIFCVAAVAVFFGLRFFG